MSESSAQALHASATDRTGLSDFGDDLYRAGLAILLAAYDENPYFNELGRRAAHDQVVTALSARLRACPKTCR
jgi:hypothetical protein